MNNDNSATILEFKPKAHKVAGLIAPVPQDNLPAGHPAVADPAIYHEVIFDLMVNVALRMGTTVTAVDAIIRTVFPANHIDELSKSDLAKAMHFLVALQFRLPDNTRGL